MNVTVIPVIIGASRTFLKNQKKSIPAEDKILIFPSPPMNVLLWHENIWWWGSSVDGLGNVEYTVTAITPKSTLTRSDSTI